MNAEDQLKDWCDGGKQFCEQKGPKASESEVSAGPTKQNFGRASGVPFDKSNEYHAARGVSKVGDGSQIASPKNGQHFLQK